MYVILSGFPTSGSSPPLSSSSSHRTSWRSDSVCPYPLHPAPRRGNTWKMLNKVRCRQSFSKLFAFFPPGLFSFWSLRSPSLFFGLWSPPPRQPLCMVGLFVYVTSELAGPIYSDIDAPFCSEKKCYSLFPVDGMSIPVIFSKNQSHALCKIILSRLKNSWRTTGIKFRSPMHTIFTSKHSPSELAGRGQFYACIWFNM